MIKTEDRVESMSRLLEYLDQEIDRGGTPEKWHQAQTIRELLDGVGDDLMLEAWRLTNGDRRQAYGPPEEVFHAYAQVWSGLLARKLREPLSAADVALCMTGLKLCREANAPKPDNLVDAHGYLSLLGRIRGWVKGRS